MNILAGDRAELAPHFASHMDVNAIVDGSGDAEIGRALQRGGALNVKRYIKRSLNAADWATSEAENPYWILDTVEMKTLPALAAVPGSLQAVYKALSSTPLTVQCVVTTAGGAANFTSLIAIPTA